MTLQQQIDRLANFIMAEVDGEPSRSEGAVDCAIRVLREHQEYCRWSTTGGDDVGSERIHNRLAASKRRTEVLPKLTCVCGGNIKPVGVARDGLHGYDGGEWECARCSAFYKQVPYLYCEQGGSGNGFDTPASKGDRARLKWVD